MERSSFLPPREKRSGAPDPTFGFGSSKRVKTHHAQAQLHSPLSVPAGHVAFRMLCLVSQVAAFIGKSGSVIKQLQQSTGSKIRVEEAVIDSPDQVITVIVQVGSTSRVKLGITNASNGEDEEEFEVTKAQEALIRVFEVLSGELGIGPVSCRMLTEASHAGALIGKGGKMVEKIRKETGCKVVIRKDKLPICADPDDEMVEIEGNVLAVKKALVYISRCLQDCQPTNKIRMVGNRSLDRVFQASLHSLEACSRPLEVSSHDYRLRTADTFSHGTLLRSSDMIPHDALHRHNDAVPCDALRRTVDVVPQEALYRASDVFQRDVLRKHREMDPRDSLFRPFEMLQNDALGRSFESFPPDGFQRRIETMTSETITQPMIDFLSNNSQRHSDFASTSMTHPVTVKHPLSPSKNENQEVNLKILCSSESAGGVIGTGGIVIRTLHSETGASINVGNSLADCNERLIVITASENPRERNSSSQRAIVLVFSRLYELATKKSLDTGSRSSITARLVVPTNLIGCLLGKGGSIISEMRRTTGATIQVLKVEQNPKCVSQNDQVVQISGEFPNVKEAIYHITGRLQENIFFNSPTNGAANSNAISMQERISHGETTHPISMGFDSSSSYLLTMSTSQHRKSDVSFQRRFHSSINSSRLFDADPNIRPEYPFPNTFSSTAAYAPIFGRRSTMNLNDIPHQLSEPPSRLWASPPPRRIYDARGGLSSTRADHGLGRYNSAIVTNTTVEIRVPENAISFVYGEDGHNLQQLKQISGARVTVHEPHLGTSDRIIVISGTPDQTQVAQNLLHAFILKGETSKMKRHTLN